MMFLTLPEVKPNEPHLPVCRQRTNAGVKGQQRAVLMASQINGLCRPREYRQMIVGCLCFRTRGYSSSSIIPPPADIGPSDEILRHGVPPGNITPTNMIRMPL